MRRFLVKKTGDCGSPPTPKKPKADSERLVAAREYEDRRRRGFKAAWRDEFAWLTYEPAPADSDSNGARLPTVLLLTWNVTGAHADQTTKRLAALAVPLVMLVYQTQESQGSSSDEGQWILVDMCCLLH